MAEALRRRRGGCIRRGRLGKIGRGAGAGLNGVRWLKYQKTSKEGSKPFLPPSLATLTMIKEGFASLPPTRYSRRLPRARKALAAANILKPFSSLRLRPSHCRRSLSSHCCEAPLGIRKPISLSPSPISRPRPPRRRNSMLNNVGERQNSEQSELGSSGEVFQRRETMGRSK